MAQSYQHHNLPYSNGWHGWEGSEEISPRPSSHTSPTYSQHMWMPICLSQHANPHCYNASFGVLKGTQESVKGSPSCQSHAQYSPKYWRPPLTPLCSASSISRLQPPQPLWGSSGVGSLQHKAQNISTQD